MKKEKTNDDLLQESNDELLSEVLSEAKNKKLGTVKIIEEILQGDNRQNNTEVRPIKGDNKQNNIQTEEYDYDKYSFDAEDDSSEEYEYEDVPYDMVPLPSLGKIYKNIKPRIAVAYLTAADEDLITSPNLYLDGKIFDTLLRRKIMNKKIKPEDLCDGDRNAIILWLRATGYGENFPVNVTDPVSGENFESTIDLSKLKIKELTLTPDKNGLFDYVLPKSKSIVKFRFMTHKDDVGYTKLLTELSPKIKKHTLNNSYDSIRNIIESDNSIGMTKKIELTNCLTTIKEYIDSINDDGTQYLRNITYLLDRTIVSIDGNTDRGYIKKYISMMPVADSVSFRKYLKENTPGIDFNTIVEKPKSLGGGSISTFLELDHTIFLDFS